MIVLFQKDFVKYFLENIFSLAIIQKNRYNIYVNESCGLKHVFEMIQRNPGGEAIRFTAHLFVNLCK